MPISINLLDQVHGTPLQVRVTLEEDGYVAHGEPVMDEHRVFLLFFRRDNAGRAGEQVVELPSIAYRTGPLHYITILAILDNQIVARDRREVRNGMA